MQIPGDPGFALAGFLHLPKSAEEGDVFREYIRQCREEVSARIVNFCFRQDDGKPDKFWMAFAKRTFMNKEIN